MLRRLVEASLQRSIEHLPRSIVNFVHMRRSKKSLLKFNYQYQDLEKMLNNESKQGG